MEATVLRQLPRVLSGEDLSGVAAASRPLRRRRWTNSTLSRCDLTAADLRGSEFRRCLFVDCRFTASRLAGSVLVQTTLRRCDLRETDWRECLFRETVLEDCETDRAAFALAVFEDFRHPGTTLAPSQVGRSFDRGVRGAEGPFAGQRPRRRLGPVAAATLIVAAFALAGVAYHLAQDPAGWSRDTFVRNIEWARGEGDLARVLRLADEGLRKWGTDPGFAQFCRGQKADVLIARGDGAGDTGRSRVAAEAAFAERDDNPRVALDSLLHRAEMLISRRQEGQALAILREARGKVPLAEATCEGVIRLAGFFEQLGEPGAAAELLRELAGSRGLPELRRLDAQLHLAGLLYRQGRAPEAEAVCQDILAHSVDAGHVSHALETLALLASQRGDFERAAACWREIPRRLPDLAWAREMSWWGLAGLWEQAGRLRDALGSLQSILESSEDPSRLSWSLLKTFQIAGRLEDAATAGRAYQRLQEEFPDSEPAHLARLEQASLASAPAHE